MGSIDSRMVIEGLVTLVFTLFGWWLAAEKSEMKSALRTNEKNSRTEHENERAARKELEEKHEARLKDLENAEKNWWTRAEQLEFRKELHTMFERFENKLDRALERKERES